MNTDTVVVLYGFFATGCIVALVFALEYRKFRRFRTFFKKLAQGVNGRVICAHQFSMPILFFTYRDIEIYVFIAPMESGRFYRGKEATLISVLAHFPFRLGYQFYIYPRNETSRINREIALPTIRPADKIFSPDYDIKSNNADFIASLFTIDVEEKMRPCLKDRPILEFVQNTYNLTAPFSGLNETTFMQFIDSSRSLVARLKEIGEYQ